MADLTRPNFGEAWASEGEKLSPGEAKLKMGWVQEMMTCQYENYLQARQDEAILYLLQKGVPEYSATQEYTANKSVVVYQGNLYMATSTVTGVLPTVTASWKRISPTVGANGAVSISSGGTGATTAAEARTNLGLGTASTANLPTTNGVVVRSADNTLISRLLTGTSGNISVTNPDGVAGNINIDVGSNVAKLDTDSSWTSKGGITLPKGSSGERGVEVPGKIRYNTELQKFEGHNGASWNALGAASEVEITTLSGDGVTTSFTLTAPAFSETSTDVYIGGVWQNKGTYNVSGSTITFSEAPTPGTDNIQIVSRRVVDLGVANASQVGIQDTSNYYTATTVEGALREVGEDFAKLTSYSGNISADAEWSEVPAHSDPAFDVQAQALANRTEMLMNGVGGYSEIRGYAGNVTRLKVQDPTGVHWWVRRGNADDNGCTVLVDALGRSWEREFSGVVSLAWMEGVYDGDASEKLQLAIDIAKGAGAKILKLPAGVVTAKNLVVEGVEIVFDAGAWINAALGPSDNVFVLGSNAKLVNPKIEISTTGAPTSGNFGNAIRIGDYVADETVYSGISVQNPTIVCTDTTRRAYGILVLGNVEDVEIDAPKLYGAFAIGIEAHWGGDVDLLNPHANLVTVSYHPNNIRIRDSYFGKHQGRGGGTAMILSAVYNVHWERMDCDGWLTPIYIIPGDVFEQVVNPRQAGRVMTGVRVRDVVLKGIPARSSGATKFNAPVLLQGVSATVRTAYGKVSFAADHDFDVQIDGLTLVNDGTYANAPLILAQWLHNTKIRGVKFIGFDAVSQYAAVFEFNLNSEIETSGSANFGVSATSNVGCSILIDSIRKNIAPTTAFAVNAQGTLSNATLSSAVPIGATAITIGVVNGALQKGQRVYIGPDFLRYYDVAESIQLNASGPNIIKIKPAPFSTGASTGVRFRFANIDTRISGRASGWYYSVVASETHDLKVDLDSRFARKYDVFFTGTSNDVFSVKGSYNFGGQLNDGSVTANVAIGSAVTGGDICITAEEAGETLVRFNVMGSVENIVGVTVAGCKLLGAKSNNIALVDGGSSNPCLKNQIYGNQYGGSPQGGTLSATTLAGHYVGDRYVGFATSAPTTGAWTAGSRIYDSSGATNGWRYNGSAWVTA